MIDSFFTQILMLLSAAGALTIGIVHRKKHKELGLIFLYPMASIIQCFAAYFSWIADSDPGFLEADLISESIFILIESLLLYNFFRQVTVLRNLKRFITIVFILYLSCLLFLWITTSLFYIYSSRVYLLESFAIPRKVILFQF